MRNAPGRAEHLRRSLVTTGFAPAYVSRVVAEMEDHRSDLQREGLEQGLTTQDAAIYAEERLGPPERLLEQLILAHRQHNWWARHPALLFGFTPILLFILCFVGGALYLGAIGSYQGWWGKTSTLTDDRWLQLSQLVPLFQFLLMVGIPVLFCHLARQFCYAWKWPLAACAILSLHGFFHFLSVTFPLAHEKGMVSWGYGLHQNNLGGNLWTALPPLLVFGLYYFLARRRHARELAPLRD